MYRRKTVSFANSNRASAAVRPNTFDHLSCILSPLLCNSEIGLIDQEGKAIPKLKERKFDHEGLPANIEALSKCSTDKRMLAYRARECGGFLSTHGQFHVSLNRCLGLHRYLKFKPIRDFAQT